MSDKDPAMRGIHVPETIRSDVVYSARMILDQILSGMPTKQSIDGLFESFAGAYSMGNPLVRAGIRMATAMQQSWLGLSTSREALEERWLQNPVFLKWLASRDAAKWMWEKGDPKGNPDEIVKWNDRLYTHNPDGGLNHIKSDDILRHFVAGHEDEWPQIVLTSNHADTRSSLAVSGIMRNLSALLRAVLPAGSYELERHPDTAESVKGKTIMVSALYAEDTAARNGADLMYRIIHLRENEPLASRIVVQPKKNDTLDAAEHTHRGPSPAAIRLGKLMLKLMLEHPDALDQSPTAFVDERRTVAEMLRDGDVNLPRPMVLRADAEAIAKHITLMGYSKAANTVNDAVRYLAYELTSLDPSGTPLFARRDADGAAYAITEPADVRPIIRKLGIIGINGPGVPLTDEERDLGMYRLRLRNEYDQIAGHFDHNTGSRRTVDKFDVVHTIQGTRDGLGHLAIHALGLDEVKGYIEKDAEAVALLGKVLTPKFARVPPPESWLARIDTGELTGERQP